MQWFLARSRCISWEFPVPCTLYLSLTRNVDVILHSFGCLALPRCAPVERTPERGFLLLTSMYQRRSRREIALLDLFGFLLCCA